VQSIGRTGADFMLRKDVTITNNIGLHARPATFFIQKANSFKSSIWIEKDDRKVNAKSLLGVLSMGIAKGMTVTLVADGQDETGAINGLVELIETGFAE
jgi:phosphocarrier protein